MRSPFIFRGTPFQCPGYVFMKIRFLPIRETVTTGVAFANTGTAIPQTVLGARPSDAYQPDHTRKKKRKKRREDDDE